MRLEEVILTLLAFRSPNCGERPTGREVAILFQGTPTCSCRGAAGRGSRRVRPTVRGLARIGRFCYVQERRYVHGKIPTMAHDFPSTDALYYGCNYPNQTNVVCPTHSSYFLSRGKTSLTAFGNLRPLILLNLYLLSPAIAIVIPNIDVA